MRKIALLILLSLPIFAGFFPQTVQTTVTDVNNHTLILKNSLPNGMSGIVIHSYGNNVEAIIARITQENHITKILKGSILHHDNLPGVNTHIKVNDKVIGGYLYQNVLLLAPDAESYSKITSQYPKTWIHPDLFALYLTELGDLVPTKENLASFAKQYQVGLICIVEKNTLKLLDPISSKIVGKTTMEGLPKEGKAPFFMRLDDIEVGMFASSNTKSFYQIMKAL